MHLTIIIPAHNEEKTLKEVVKRTHEVFADEEHEIIIVDDGSEQIVQSSTLHNLLVLRHDKNYGKGRAIRTGLGRASGEYIAIQDADLEYDPRELYKLWQMVKNGKEVIYGKRAGTEGYLLARLANKFISFVCNFLYQSSLSDIYTCYKIIPSKLMKSLDLQSEGFEIEAEITAKILKRKINIMEIPIVYTPRTYGEGKHIKWKDGFKGIWALLKNRF